MADNELPWIRICKNGYSKRLRVINFTPVGKRGFTTIIREALEGDPAYFIMQDGDPIPLTATTLEPPEETESVAYDGTLIDADGNPLDTDIRGLKLSQPPINTDAAMLAARAWSLDQLVDNSLPDITVPTNVVSGTSPDVSIVKDPNRNPADWTKFDANDDNATVLRPEPGRLAQWSNEQIRVLQQTTLQEFMMSTGLPPQDAPILDTLGSATQSLISNRESFVSNTYVIKQDVTAVFHALGVELEWEMAFPQTASDIASIGDAYGKGLDSSILRDYQVV